MDEQWKHLDDLKHFFEYRQSLLNKAMHWKRMLQNQEDFPTPNEMKSQLAGQLSLFPTGASEPLLKWNSEKVDFVELLTALYESESVVGIKAKLTKKDFFQFLQWAFNVPIGDVNGTLKAAKNRKTMEAPYLSHLVNVYCKYKERIFR